MFKNRFCPQMARLFGGKMAPTESTKAVLFLGPVWNPPPPTLIAVFPSPLSLPLCRGLHPQTFQFAQQFSGQDGYPHWGQITPSVPEEIAFHMNMCLAAMQPLYWWGDTNWLR